MNLKKKKIETNFFKIFNLIIRIDEDYLDYGCLGLSCNEMD